MAGNIALIARCEGLAPVVICDPPFTDESADRFIETWFCKGWTYEKAIIRGRIIDMQDVGRADEIKSNSPAPWRKSCASKK